MIRLALLSCIATLALPAPVQATTAMGIGTRDCTAFLRAREIGSEQAIDSYVSWGLGYLSGRNAASRGKRPVFVDGGSLVHWLGAWCEDHTSAPIFEAMEAFAGESGS
jgi:hypothetical protein